MNCPNCHFPIEEGTTVCKECGVDYVLFEKTKRISNKLYNKGVLYAKSGDYSGAEKFLTESIAIDKMHYKARNLLGLVYFEKGMVTNALEQWIISSSMVKDNNPAKDYIAKIQNNTRLFENLCDAIHLYNQAINKLYQNSDDLAVIHLKKAIDLSPKLVEAYNLLALCYINYGDNSSAYRLLNAALKIDNQNPKSLRYINEIMPGSKGLVSGLKAFETALEEKKTKEEAEKKAAKAKKPVKSKKNVKRTFPFGKNEIIACAAGVACTAIVFLTLITPAINEDRTKTINDLTSKVTSLTEENTKLSEEVTNLRTENEQISAELGIYKMDDILLEKVNVINTVEGMINNSQFEEAADLISTIDSTGLEGVYLDKYNNVKSSAYTKAAQSMYNKGKSAYLSNTYDMAKEYFENALTLVSNEDFVDDIYYYLGKIAVSNGNNTLAKTYFEKVINEYPDSNQYQNSVNSLNSL